jgi:hypothetical protein
LWSSIQCICWPSKVWPFFGLLSPWPASFPGHLIAHRFSCLSEGLTKGKSKNSNCQKVLSASSPACLPGKLASPGNSIWFRVPKTSWCFQTSPDPPKRSTRGRHRSRCACRPIASACHSTLGQSNPKVWKKDFFI